MIPQRRHLPDLRLLQSFDSAARHGSFTRAAAELSLTQSAVSRQIRELEAQIGRALFERVRGRVVLTEAGQGFLAEVAPLLRLAETVMRHASAGAEGETLLAVNAGATFATRWLVPRLPDFLRRHPGIRFDLTTRPGVFDFANTQCDLAIHFGRPLWPGATCTYLCSEIVVPVAGGALRDLAVERPEALAAAPKLHVNERPTLWSDWFARAGLTLERANEGHWFDQFSLSIEAAKAGMGYALLPRYLIEGELASGALRIVLDLPHATDNSYHIAIPEGRGATVEAFRDWLIGAVSFRPLA